MTVMVSVRFSKNEYSILGNDRKSLRTFAPAGYRDFWNYSHRQIPRQIPVPICLD